ncbi:MAG TPA: TolC family protein [Candidatus Sulfotelmatobacter sp.]|nr:TolC family protein [Candidatus Sulfotelmatobacter sp.]
MTAEALQRKFIAGSIVHWRRRLMVHCVMACFWLWTAGVAFAQQPLDLRSALTAAEAGNLELRAVRQQRALAIAGLTTARQMPNPVLSFTVARDTPHEGVSLDFPLELGGKRGKRIAVAQEEQKAAEIDIGILSRQIRRRTREAFYRSLSAREQTAQAKTALDISTRIRDLAQQRFEVGDVAQLEVLQADVELARSSADYEITAQAQRAADVALAALLNRQLGADLSLQGKLDEVPLAPEFESLTARALQSSGDLLKATQDLKTEERRLELAKAQRIPNLDLSAGGDFNSPPDFKAGGKGGLSVTLPLFYHGQGEVAQSTARLELLRLMMAAQRTKVSAEVAAAYFDYSAKGRLVQQYHDRVMPETIRLERMAEDSYQSGKTNVLTLLDAQRRLGDVRKAYLEALLSAQTSFAVLEEAVGVPLD